MILHMQLRWNVNLCYWTFNNFFSWIPFLGQAQSPGDFYGRALANPTQPEIELSKIAAKLYFLTLKCFCGSVWCCEFEIKLVITDGNEPVRVAQWMVERLKVVLVLYGDVFR